MALRRIKSRVVTGFHRLGVVVAAPVLLGALAIAISSIFSEDGPVVPDPTASPAFAIQTLADPARSGAERIVAQQLAIARAHVRMGDTGVATTIQADTGPVRTFTLYWADGRANDEEVGEDTRKTVLSSLAAFEKKRGSVLNAGEQPLLVGPFLVQEAEDKREQTWRSWTHLTRGFDYERLMWAGVSAAAAILIYLFARAVGWIADGFVTPRAS